MKSIVLEMVPHDKVGDLLIGDNKALDITQQIL
jgi:hypothetical protein